MLDYKLMTQLNFTGAKAAVFYEDKLLVYLRDNKPEIPFPNKWDFTGGGREGNENPFECLQREIFEEFKIKLSEDQILWHKEYPSVTRDGWVSHFFVARITKDQVEGVVFGDEGQKWTFMTPEEFLATDAAFRMQDRLSDYLLEKNKN